MKKITATLFITLTTLTPTAPVLAEDLIMTEKTASFIPMNAASGKTREFAEFLIDAAPLVEATEPGTELWFALQAVQSDRLAIVDIFDDAASRDLHFSGQVAQALQANATQLVDGGWDTGVVANIRMANVLSEKPPVNLNNARTASYIEIQAAPGQTDHLEQLLAGAGAIVSETEPHTLYWVAMRLDQNRYAIFDLFADSAGKEMHFAGQVANLLKQKSSHWVEGGWEQGVVANVIHFDVLAIKQ